MATYNTVAYCSGDLGPGNIQKYLAQIQQSGLTTAVLWAVHIGRPSIPGQKYGDLIFNDMPNLFVSQGAFNPSGSPAIAAWPGQVAQLKQKSSVSRIFFSIGGANPPVYDFTSIQYMLQHGMKNVLVDNFTCLKKAFTVNGTCVIDGIDLDCEEGVDENTMVVFCQILFGLGFKVTFCPFTSSGWWQSIMQTLWNQNMKVSWWNLQCYAGGGGNQPSDWIKTLAKIVGAQAAPSYLIPGLGVQDSDGGGQCPFGSGSICQTFAGWSSLKLPGGFLWNFDTMSSGAGCTGPVTLPAYVNAINQGLSNNCGS